MNLPTEMVQYKEWEDMRCC